MPRMAATVSVEMMLRVIRLSNDLARAAGAPGVEMPLEEFAARAGLSPEDAARVIRKIDLGLGDTLPGLSIDYDPERGTVAPHATGTALDRPLRLSPTEAQALIAAVEAAGIDSSASSLIEKIEGAFPPVPVERFADIRSAAQVAGLGPILAAMTHAIDARKVLRIVYRGTRDTEALPRTIEPRTLTFDPQERTWYLSAFCRRAQAPRTFKLARIERIEETGETFDVPGGASSCGNAGSNATGVAGAGATGTEAGGTATSATPYGATGTLADIDDAPLAILAVHRPQGLGERSGWRGLLVVDAPQARDRSRLTEDERTAGGYIAAIPWASGSAWLPRRIAATFGDIEAVRPADLRAAVRAEAARLLEQAPI